MIIELYRHGRTAGNLRHVYLGTTDEPLCEEGRADLVCVDEAEQVVYASPRIRCLETARILFPHAQIQTIPGFEEMDFGDFEGRNWEDMKDDQAYRAWVDSYCEAPCPNGEALFEFQARVCAAFDELVDTALARGDELLRIVGHGGTNMSILGGYARPAHGYFHWQTPPGQCWTVRTDVVMWAHHRLDVVQAPSKRSMQ